MSRLTHISHTALVSLGCLLVCATPGFAYPQQKAPATNPNILTAPPIAPASAATSNPVPKAGSVQIASPAAIVPVYVPELTIAGHTVMRLRATAGGLSPDERAFDLRRRLGPILTLPDLTANDVTVRQGRPRQTASIYVRGRLLITVDRNLAKANDSAIANLAEQWANNLKTFLPQVNVSVRMFDVSTGN